MVIIGQFLALTNPCLSDFILVHLHMNTTFMKPFDRKKMSLQLTLSEMIDFRPIHFKR